MKDYVRIFPRYELGNIKNTLIFNQGMGVGQLVVHNISLGGMQVRSTEQKKLPSRDQVEVILLGTQRYNLLAIKVWELHQAESNVSMYGYRFLFDEEKDFERWKTLMKAIHMLKQKMLG